ncbi:hypothetical protein JNUCC0626_13100 [Lentzea sp. JNUCC 0626]|uniref:hypothetical protein n=1 Tax=Lentzea sp. JNUCC 0626 TaxID=3367513 RepID=UPI003747BAF0
MTSCTTNDLFSHTETQHPGARSTGTESGRPIWTNLFQEPGRHRDRPRPAEKNPDAGRV